MIIAASVARALVIVFWLASAAYAFLLSVPFVYEQFLLPGLVPALVAFARWQGVLSLVAAPLLALALWPDLAARRALVSGGLLIWLASMAGVGGLVASPLTTLQPGAWALTLAAAALVPVIWLAVIDLTQATWTDAARTTDPLARDAVVTLFAAVASVSLFAAAGLATTRAFDPLGAVLSVSAHALLFAALFAVFVLVRAVADLTSKPSQWEAFGAVVMVAALLGIAAAVVILPAVSQRDGPSQAVVTAFGATIGLVLASRGARHGHARERDGLVLALGGILPRWAQSHRPIQRAGWAVLVVAVAVAFRAASGSMDWNFVVAKMGAVVVWVLVLATAAQWTPARVYLPSATPFGVCAAVLAVYLVAAGRLPFGPVTVDAAMRAGDVWAVGDPSFRTLRDWLQRPVPQVEATAADGGAPADGVGFFDFLQAHTNIGRSIQIAPVAVRLADLSVRREVRRPHVFVFVIDSLRRDYLSPYNPAVTFTPAIQQFAAESTVFTRAFTRYGATGLSVPSIWVGGMVLHKQYVLPFAPMNALHDLLGHHGYRRWMSMDNIVEIIMPRDGSLDEIDRGVGVGDFRMCASIDDVRKRLDRLTADAAPTFVWSLPQDVHVAVLNREGNAAVDGRAYDAFYPPYASRVRRFDECFGGFVNDLKAKGLYDDSLIVLTSDHGDSLGEEGRWGHAYTLYPEVVQVPLVVHLPAYARAGLETDAAQLAFTTDITPTLHALLGHTVTAPSPIFGQPLYWPKGAAKPARPPFGLMASSYGSIYGWVDAAGEQMYIADGVALRDYVYRLDGSGTGIAETVTPAARAAGQRAIRGGIQAIADYYQFTPPTR
ncbi:MAG: sulfatase-like hydrolase/transferase [Acidobacteria bacterium]|nr:sulfatase-like hydrolase/transferase [Acidobacteriota bacterium]